MSVKLTPSLTRAAKRAHKDALRSFSHNSRWYRLVDCEGEAHSNAHIDNCGLCAPFWGYRVAESDLGTEVISHCQYLTGTLIPDLRTSGSEATAIDFERCVELIVALAKRR